MLSSSHYCILFDIYQERGLAESSTLTIGIIKLTLRFDFQGKRVFLTGATGDVGKALVRGFLDTGAKLVATGRSSEKLRLIRGPEEMLKKISCNLENIDEVKAMSKVALAWLGGCDIFVHTAANMLVKDPLSLDELDWKRTLCVNLLAPYFCIQSAMPALRNSPAGRIILFGSGAGKSGGLGPNLTYGASKGGILAMTFNLARELAETNVTVNCLVPGPIDGPLMREFGLDLYNKALAKHPMGRFAMAAELVPPTLFLASEEAAHITGEALDVNGGYFTD